MGIKLAQSIAALEGDEARLVQRVLDRLNIGRREYGAWLASGEKRNLRVDTLEEILDTVIYLAMILEAKIDAE